jgi:hypothetical protein
LPFAAETLEARNAVGREVPVGDLAHAAPKLKPGAHIGARIQDKAGAFDSLIIVLSAEIFTAANDAAVVEEIETIVRHRPPRSERLSSYLLGPLPGNFH